jgi:hypothetical protein
MDAQVTATTITRLQRIQLHDPQQYAFIQTQNWADIRDNLDKFTYSGDNSLRATMTAAGAADGFRLMTEGVAAVAHTGVSTQQVPIARPAAEDPTQVNDRALSRWAFTFAARCSVDGNLIRVRLILRSAAGAGALAYWNNATGEWQATGIAGAVANDFGMTTRWQRYGVVATDDVPQIVGANVVDNMVWQVSNGSAGAQIIDLDDFEIYRLDSAE